MPSCWGLEFHHMNFEETQYLVYSTQSFSGSSDSKESAFTVETRVWSLGQEDPLEKGMVTYSSILA